MAKIKDLPTTKIAGDIITADDWNLIANNNVPLWTEPEPALTMQDIIELVKAELNPTPLNKCGACGQWGCAYTQCRHCGSPVNPGEYRADLL